ncbi:hypothetical protein [Ureibacillus sinduriensis]|nr:hypothetical protein [Ureibacillus sinduriensis]
MFKKDQTIEASKIFFSTSIGITIYPHDGNTTENLSSKGIAG